jgi:hypothetical protein
LKIHGFSNCKGFKSASKRHTVLGRFIRSENLYGTFFSIDGNLANNVFNTWRGFERLPADLIEVLPNLDVCSENYLSLSICFSFIFFLFNNSSSSSIGSTSKTMSFPKSLISMELIFYSIPLSLINHPSALILLRMLKS